MNKDVYITVVLQYVHYFGSHEVYNCRWPSKVKVTRGHRSHVVRYRTECMIFRLSSARFDDLFVKNHHFFIARSHSFMNFWYNNIRPSVCRHTLVGLLCEGRMVRYTKRLYFNEFL